MPRAVTSAVAGVSLCLLLLTLNGSSASEENSRLMKLLTSSLWDFGGSALPKPGLDLNEVEMESMLPGDPATDYNDEDRASADGNMRELSVKRSAVATALNSGRRRRQPSPALGKGVTAYIGVGVLNDVGSFFNSLRDNLETLASLSPQQRATLLHEPPTVVHSPSQGGGGGGSGMRRLYALRPLRPTGNTRSFVDSESVYPAANHHDPGLLWTGLGRRRRR